MTQDFTGGKPGKTGLRRIINALGYSWTGFTQAWQSEAAFRQELTLVVILTPIAIWLAANKIQLALLLASLFIVLIVEILNSAIEAVVDRIGLEFHPLSGQAKNMGSAAVTLALLQVVVVWGLVAAERFFG